MDRGAWQGTVLGSQRVGHDGGTNNSTRQGTKGSKCSDTTYPVNANVSAN